MKITKARLKEIIREEMDKLVASGEVSIEEGSAPKDDEPKQDRRYIDFKDDEGTTITGDAKKKKKTS